jgi:hypothetical protein
MRSRGSSDIFDLFFDLILALLFKGGYGTLAGVIASTVIYLGALLPGVIKNGGLCVGQRGCNDELGWIAIGALVVVATGAILGALFGFAGKEIAVRAKGPENERTGSIAGGLVGGITPWLFLLILGN